MEFSNNIGEYKESIIRPKALPRETEQVGKDIEYSNKLRKAHDIMKILDLPDSRDDMIRKILLKQNDKVLDEVSKKSKQDIMIFLKQRKNKEQDVKNQKLNQENKKLNQENHELIKENEKQNQDIQKNQEKETKLNQDIQKIKSVFTPQILEQNTELATEIKNLDKEGSERQKALDNIKDFLKQPGQLKSITDQLGGADKNNPQYLEFKNALIGVDSGFEQYFNDLEKIKSGASLDADKVIKGISKDSGGMMDIDLKSNPPISKLSLIGSPYGFSEEIDKKSLDKITVESKTKLKEAQNSGTVLEGLYKPFDKLVSEANQYGGKENFKEHIQGAVANFSRTVFGEADEMYEKMGVKSDIQVKESDMLDLANSNSESEFKQKAEIIKEKFEKIKLRIKEVLDGVVSEYESGVKELVSKDSETRKKQMEVLKFMNSCGFDKLPQDMSDNIMEQLKAGSLTIPGLDLNRKNIDLKNGHFGESSTLLDEDGKLNIEAKRNMVKFVNKLIGGNTNEPLNVESIANGDSSADPALIEGKLLESGVVDAVGWSEGKAMMNLEKANVDAKVEA